MKILILFFLGFLTLGLRAQITLSVDINRKIKNLNGYENGINSNYLMDDAFPHANSFSQTITGLKNMKVKMLRYPGGEKADNYLWSAAPWEKAIPRMAIKDTNAWPTNDTSFVNISSPDKVCKESILDFDEFMSMCIKVGAKPLIVVAYDAMYVKYNNIASKKRPTKSQLIENAKQWVRYANVVKKFNIKYWMIGNESWNSPDYNGKTTPGQYALDLISFASAMKSVDPNIKIVANGRADWWPTLLKSAAVKWIDVLGFSNYPVYNYSYGYEYYRTHSVNFISEVKAAESALNTYCNTRDKARITLMPVEYNSIDWSEKWPSNNNLGHALANFQMFGDLVSHPKVTAAFLWNTRWVDTTATYHIYDALGKNGNLNATGYALRVWGSNLYNSMVYASSTNSRIKIYSSYDTVTKQLNVLILNKDIVNKTVTLKMQNYVSVSEQIRYVFTGKNLNDVAPQSVLSPDVNLNSFTLPKTSVTILKFSPYTTLNNAITYESCRF